MTGTPPETVAFPSSDELARAAALPTTQDLQAIVDVVLVPTHGSAVVAQSLLAVYARLVEQSGRYAAACEALDRLKAHLRQRMAETPTG